MAKAYEFNWRPSVPDRLLKGDYFDRWDEVRKRKYLFSILFKMFKKIIKETGQIDQNVLFRCDEYGFFLHWQPDGKVNFKLFFLSTRMIQK